MKILFSPTEPFIKKNVTQIVANVAAGSAVAIPVSGSDGFATYDYVAVGFEGGENCELTTVASTGATTITVDTLIKVHYTEQPITLYRFNKRKFYGCATIDGSYVELTDYGSPVLISVNDQQGAYLEYTGNEGYVYFKSTYLNSHTNEETSINDAIAVLADETARYCSLYAIRKQAGLTNNPFATDALVETYRKRAENEVDSYLSAKYILPLINASGEEEIPFIVENCTVLLAAGYMDYQEFGRDGEGVKWLGEARAILKQLQSPGGQQLIGSDRVEMQTKTDAQQVKGFPESVDNQNGPKQWFTMNQTF